MLLYCMTFRTRLLDLILLSNVTFLNFASTYFFCFFCFVLYWFCWFANYVVPTHYYTTLPIRFDLLFQLPHHQKIILFVSFAGCQPSMLLLEGLEHFTPPSSTSILNSAGDLEKSFLKVMFFFLYLYFINAKPLNLFVLLLFLLVLRIQHFVLKWTIIFYFDLIFIQICLCIHTWIFV